MSRLDCSRIFFSVIGKALMTASFLFVVLQATSAQADSLVERAKNEGKLTFYASLSVTDFKAVGDAFMKKYPFIKFEYWRVGSSTLNLQKNLMDKRAGKMVADVLQLNGSDINIFRREGLMQMHVSPETKDWQKGFADPEGYWNAYYTSNNCWAYNTKMVNEKDVPKSYDDFLDPKWKGNIGFGSSETEWYEGMMQSMGREKALAFMKRFAGQVKIYNGKTLSMQMCAAGEFPIVKGILHRAVDMIKMGAPIKVIDLPTPTLAGLRVLTLTAGGPHPNAGKLFIDFMLSKEGQETLVKINYHPIRMDVKVDPYFERARRNMFPIRASAAEQTSAYIKEFQKVILNKM